MIRCSACGGENRLGDVFCEECGADISKLSLPLWCLSCGQQNTEGNKFCEACGSNQLAINRMPPLNPPDLDSLRKNYAERVARHACPWCGKQSWDAGNACALPVLWQDEGLYRDNPYVQQQIAWILVFTCQICTYAATFKVGMYHPHQIG